MSIRARTVSLGMLIVYATVIFAAGCTIRARRLERRLERSYAPEEGEYPDLRDPLFAPRSRFTGILRADRFNQVLGFWIFLQQPHRPELLPVVLVHGHASGPRKLERLAESLDPNRFEPWFCYYATGIELDRSAYLLRRRLSEMTTRYDESRVAVVTYSFGGLVMRQALRPADDDVRMPEIPLVVNISVPWGGATQRRFTRDRTFTPASWEDLAVGSRFLKSLFDDPLPAETQSHIIYGLGGRDRRSIPGDDDRILSERSMTRPEALAEAATVTVLREATHLETVEDTGTLTVVNRLLDELVAPGFQNAPQLQPRPGIANRISPR